MPLSQDKTYGFVTGGNEKRRFVQIQRLRKQLFDEPDRASLE